MNLECCPYILKDKTPLILFFPEKGTNVNLTRFCKHIWGVLFHLKHKLNNHDEEQWAPDEFDYQSHLFFEIQIPHLLSKIQYIRTGEAGGGDGG